VRYLLSKTRNHIYSIDSSNQTYLRQVTVFQCSFGNQPYDSSDACKQRDADKNCCLSFSPGGKHETVSSVKPGQAYKQFNYNIRVLHYRSQKEIWWVALNAVLFCPTVFGF